MAKKHTQGDTQTENNILDNLDLPDDADELEEEQEQELELDEGQQDEDQEEEGQQDEDDDAAQSDEDDDSGESESDDADVSLFDLPQQPTPQAESFLQDDLAPTERVFPDKHGNLVNKEGKIVATKGAMRRMYEKNVRLSRAFTQTSRRMQEIESSMRGMQVLNNMPAQLGLSLPEVDTALRLMQSFKNNPTEAVMNIIAQAKASGVPLDLGESAQAIDTKAISAIIDQKVGPIAQRFAQENEQAQLAARAKEQVDAFYSSFPDAIVHDTAIAKIITQSGCTPTEAYWQLREFVARNGLEWDRPIQDQVNERRNASRQSQSSKQQRPQQTPRVSGTGSSQVSSTTVKDVADDVNATDSFAKIIRMSMKEAGI